MGLSYVDSAEKNDVSALSVDMILPLFVNQIICSLSEVNLNDNHFDFIVSSMVGVFGEASFLSAISDFHAMRILLAKCFKSRGLDSEWVDFIIQKVFAAIDHLEPKASQQESLVGYIATDLAQQVENTMRRRPKNPEKLVKQMVERLEQILLIPDARGKTPFVGLPDDIFDPVTREFAEEIGGVDILMDLVLQRQDIVTSALIQWMKELGAAPDGGVEVIGRVYASFSRIGKTAILDTAAKNAAERAAPELASYNLLTGEGM